MRTWLHLFVRLHKRYFTTLASNYFKRKGLTLENWLDSVHEGRKGDVLALLSLCMLVEKHVLVHLHNNQIWTSLRNSEDSHNVILSKVDIHLVYLGRGNFALLQKRENALQTVHRSPEIDSIVIGTFIPLSPDEDKTLNRLIFSGLGFGLDRDTKATHKDLNKSSLSTSPPLKATVPETEHEEKIPVKPVSELKLILHKLEVKPGKLIHITDELLDSITSTPYSEATRYLMQISNISNKMDYSSDSTIPYIDNTLTQNTVNRKRKTKRTQPLLKSRKRRIPHKFKLNTYGIRRHYMRKYTYKCKMVNCNRKFNNARDWNSHHCLRHGSLFQCEICHKTFPLPSSFRDHKYMHRDNQYKCMQCNHSFPFLSGVKNHKRAHLWQRLFKCFAGGCKRAFKHPQDLHRHVGLHIGKQYKCDKCGHSTYQACLLKRHQVVHKLVQKYSCENCNFKMKYRWSLDRHLNKLH